MNCDTPYFNQYIARVTRALERTIEQPADDLTYALGLGGQMLALTCLRQDNLDSIRNLVEDAMLRCLSGYHKQNLGLFQGSAGTLFCALEVDRIFEFGYADDAAYDFDEFLLDSLENDRNLPYHFDLISGIAGLLVYAAYRANQTGDNKLTIAAVDKLRRMVSIEEERAYWFTPPDWIRGFPMGDAHPMGCIDLGHAHGQTGVLSALAYAIHSGEQRLETRQLLEMGIRHLLHVERQDEPGHFGAAAGNRGNARCAWCYGDLGPASAFRFCAHTLDRADLNQKADQIMHDMAQKSPHELGFNDAWMCHGSVGSSWIVSQLAPAEQGLISALACLHEAGGDYDLLQSLEGPSGVGLLEGHAGAALALSEFQGRQFAIDWSLPFLVGTTPLRFVTQT